MSEAIQLGTFYQHLGLLSFEQTEMGRDAMEALTEGRPIDPSVASNLEVAGEVGALLHELQHFADVFGTFAGTSLVYGGLQWVKAFAGLCDEAELRRAHDPQWPDCGEWIVKRTDILRGFHFALRAERLFSRPFEPFEAKDGDDNLFVTVAMPRDGTTVRAALDGRPAIIVEPLGFEALTEGSAHLHARDVIDQYFPSLSFDAQFRVRRSPVGSDLELPDTPYMTIDILVSRWFRTHGIEEFPRSIVHQVINRVLSSAGYKVGEVDAAGVEVPMTLIGHRLHDLLDTLDPHEIIAQGVPRDDKVDRAYRAMSDCYDAGDDWDTVTGFRFDRSVRIWETWLAKHVTAPLLRKRAEAKHHVFEEPGSIRAISELVPIIVRNGHVVAANMPPEVRNAWASTVFLTSVLYQLANQGSASCPRRFRTIPGFQNVRGLARKSNCADNIAFGCGSTAGMLMDGQFDCAFEDVVRASRARHLT